MLTIWAFQSWSLFVACCFVLKSLIGRQHRHKSSPLPGPRGLPWLGPVWAVDATSIYLTFQKWAEQFGSIYQVTIFGQKFAVVSDPNVARDLLAKQGASCADRPPIALIDESKEGRYLPFLGNNDLFHKQRKFGVLLGNFTVQNNYHGRMQPEVQKLLVSLLQKEDGYDVLAERCCARITCQLAFGTPNPHAEIVHNAHRLMKNLSPGGRITNVLTPLQFLPSWLSGEKHEESQRKEYESHLWSGIFDHVREEYRKGQLPPSYASYYFDNEQRLGMTDEEATNGIAMMATVAILTITAPLARFIIAVTMNPDWQEKAQDELDRVLKGRMLELTDLPNVPTFRALVLESMRWTSPLPTGIPHRIEQDIAYKGHVIPKGTNIMACDWAMARNAAIYPDPETFDPSRYLKPSSPNYRAPLTEFPKIQGHHAFGFGRRICIGQDVAAAELLTICAALLWGFKIRPAIGPSGKQVCITTGEATPHVIPIPKRQNIEFIPRGEHKRDAILEMARSNRE